MTPALIVAAPASGSGKTVVALGLIRAFQRTGLRVGAFKVGPDYIDPAFHAAASGRPSRNLDPWAMRPGTLAENLAAVSAEADIVVGEGVMGLFDGAGDGTGSTADLALSLGLPVLLVLDVKGQAASAAATAIGFKTFRPEIDVAGLLINRVGGAGHRRTLAEALAPTDLPVVGYLPRADSLALPSRHLGLVQAGECADLEAFIERAAKLVAEHVDLAAVQTLARPPTGPERGDAALPIPPLGQRIAVARDLAFAFAYDGGLAGWRRAGAEILPFSPLADEAPAEDADAVYLPGGYPELHAGRLAANRGFLGGLVRRAQDGAAVYGECGGYMVLGRGLIDGDGARHEMAGLLPLETSFAAPRLHLGYRQIALLDDGPLGPTGARFRGHEFHYATALAESDAPPLFRASDARGQCLGEVGLRLGRVTGSFLHLIDAES